MKVYISSIFFFNFPKILINDYSKNVVFIFISSEISRSNRSLVSNIAKIITINFYNSYFGICYPINLKKFKFYMVIKGLYCIYL